MNPVARSLLLALALSASSPLLAEIPPWRPQVTSSPLVFGSLRLDPAFAIAPPAGQWQVLTTASQFNMWARSWHTFAAHRHHDLYGQSVTEEEVRSIAEAFPDDWAYHLDVEGWRGDIQFVRGFEGGASASIRIPWIEIGSPQMDWVAEDFHSGLGLSTHQREIFPADDTTIFLKHSDEEDVLFAGRELNRAGFGDVTLAGSIPLTVVKRAEQRLALAVDIPTGKRGTLQGSGGVDLTANWFSLWRLDKRDVKLASGLTFLVGGDFLGEDRFPLLPHLLFEVDQPLDRHKLWVASLAARLDGSPLWEITDGRAGYPPLFYRLGISRDLGAGRWVSFELGEELKPQTAVEADWSFHLTFGSATWR
jgi:hypothetical protein